MPRSRLYDDDADRKYTESVVAELARLAELPGTSQHLSGAACCCSRAAFVLAESENRQELHRLARDKAALHAALVLAAVGLVVGGETPEVDRTPLALDV